MIEGIFTGVSVIPYDILTGDYLVTHFLFYLQNTSFRDGPVRASPVNCRSAGPIGLHFLSRWCTRTINQAFVLLGLVLHMLVLFVTSVYAAF